MTPDEIARMATDALASEWGRSPPDWLYKAQRDAIRGAVAAERAACAAIARAQARECAKESRLAIQDKRRAMLCAMAGTASEIEQALLARKDVS